MRGLPLGFAGLLACLSTSGAAAQNPEEAVPVLEQPSPATDVQPTWPQGQGPLSGDAVATDVPPTIDLLVEPPKAQPLDAFWGYRYESSSLDWVVGGGDEFGRFSLAWDHYCQSGVNHGLGVGLQFHFLSGPQRTDMPPRVYDFSVGYQHRDRLGLLGYDVAVSVMASSDFEGDSSEGIRFPSHAVGFLSVCPTTELVFGVDYLHRGDVKLLPVAGLILLPHPDVRLEVVFPRPRVVFQLTETHRLYVGGELGGGTWAVERVTMVDDLATYRDLQLSVGLQCVKEDGRRSALEIGYLFDRRLEYTSGHGDYHPNDTAMIRLVDTF